MHAQISEKGFQRFLGADVVWGPCVVQTGARTRIMTHNQVSALSGSCAGPVRMPIRVCMSVGSYGTLTGSQGPGTVFNNRTIVLTGPIQAPYGDSKHIWDPHWQS